MRVTEKFVFFYGGVFSQWFHCSFKAQVLEGETLTFCSTEQYMMACKARLFGDEDTFKRIMATTDPSKAKQLGRMVKNFDADIWNRHAKDIVCKGNLAKFGQNLKLRNILLQYKDKIFVEASPYDKIWGIGMEEDDLRADNPSNWKGTNWLGEVINDVAMILDERT